MLLRGDGAFQPELDYGTSPAAIGRDRRPERRRQARPGDPNGPANSVSVFLNTPGLCAVQDVRGERLAGAKRNIARTHCRVGRIRRAYSRWLKKGLVISQKPKPGRVLPGGGKVELVVSRGRKL